MNRYLIERNVPGAGRLSARGAAEDRPQVGRGPRLDGRVKIQWNESLVTGDKLFCVYLADDEEALREHGRRGGFPVDGIYEISGMFDPTTATALVTT